MHILSKKALLLTEMQLFVWFLVVIFNIYVFFFCIYTEFPKLKTGLRSNFTFRDNTAPEEVSTSRMAMIFRLCLPMVERGLVWEMMSGPRGPSLSPSPSSILLESQLAVSEAVSVTLAMSCDPVSRVGCWIVLKLTSLEISLPLNCDSEDYYFDYSKETFTQDL